MKAAVYAVRCADRTEWRFSIAPEVDDAYWTNRCGKGCLIWTEPRLSLGQARRLAERLQSSQVAPGDTDRIRRELIKAGREIGMDWRGIAERLMLKELRGDRGPALDREGGNPDFWLREAAKILSMLQGRRLLEEEVESLLNTHSFSYSSEEWKALLQHAYLRGAVELGAGLQVETVRRIGRGKIRLRCVRCGSAGERHRFAYCPDCEEECPYCEECLTMGRTRFCSLVVHPVRGPVAMLSGSSEAAAGVDGVVVTKNSGDVKLGAAGVGADATEVDWDRWGLSPAQTDAVRVALAYMENGGGGAGSPFLLWAVTGAGKTEMLFPLIARARAMGQRALIATPRRDVVLELLPRLRKAFTEETVTGLYGGSEERWRFSGIVVATTHQLIRFYKAFELVIIDEMDAFPCVTLYTRRHQKLIILCTTDERGDKFSFSPYRPI